MFWFAGVALLFMFVWGGLLVLGEFCGFCLDCLIIYGVWLLGANLRVVVCYALFG